ncbi:MAG: TolC family protein, partial [Steroidobacteraceae bacterium]
VEVEQASLDVGAALQSQQTVWRTLAVTTGNPDLPFGGLQGDLEAFPNLDLNKSLDAALRDSPAIRLVGEDVERAQAAVSLARKAPIPDLQISGGLEQNFEPLGPGQRPVGLQGFAEAGVRLPLFNRNQGDVESARAEVERAKSEVGRARLQLRREIGLLFGDYAIARATAGTYESQLLPRARKAYDLYRHNYQSMAAAYPQVLIAQRTLFQLEAGYIQALDRVWQTALSIQGFALTDGLAEP